MALPDGSGTFPTFIAVSLIDLLAGLTVLVVLVGILWRFSRWRTASPENFFGKLVRSLGAGTVAKTFVSELVNRVMLQRELINDRPRRVTHLFMFWGFVGLAVTTTLDFIFNQPGNYVPLFGASLSPIRWLGNTSGVVLVVGSSIAIVRLIGIKKFRANRNFWDVWFTSLLFIVGVTGFISEYLGELAYAANPALQPAAAFTISLSASPLIVVPYGLHIASIGLLFVTAPASKFMHALTVPSLRYVDRLGILLTTKNKTIMNEHKKAKEQTMIDEIKTLYESRMKEDKK